MAVTCTYIITWNGKACSQIITDWLSKYNTAKQGHTSTDFKSATQLKFH